LDASIVHFDGVRDRRSCWDVFALRLKECMEESLHNVLVECQTEALGAGWHDRSAARRDWRNGYRERGLATVYGQLIIKVPRNRAQRLPAGGV
jgi:transposase-like protein